MSMIEKLDAWAAALEAEDRHDEAAVIRDGIRIANMPETQAVIEETMKDGLSGKELLTFVIVGMMGSV